MPKIKSNLLGPDGNHIEYDLNKFSRQAAKRTGTLKNWTPTKLWGDMSATAEREFIVERATDLVQSDPHAAGVVSNQAFTVVGDGLKPHPEIDWQFLGIEKAEARKLAAKQIHIYKRWAPYADSGRRMTAGMLQHLLWRSFLQNGEYLVLLQMIEDVNKPYMLSVQVLNPLRLKTPSDLSSRKDIKEGVEIGAYGEPIAYWIKKQGQVGTYAADSSANYMRIEARQGHRLNVIHWFESKDAEQVRGISPFASAMKTFRDMNDYLDAELVSNIVTAAFSLFIETGSVDPYFPASNMATLTETGYKSDGSSYEQRYQEFEPGQVLYGSAGEKPHAISATRPGTTFEPFIRNVKKMLSMESGIPYNVLFKDFDGMNFASFRSAMLEAWRVFSVQRIWLGQGYCQPVHKMLIEEAHLMGEYPAPNFYENIDEYTRCSWIGPPKGQIEPLKDIQADAFAVQNNLKTRSKAILERDGYSAISVFDDLEEEQEMLIERGLSEERIPNENIGA